MRICVMRSGTRTTRRDACHVFRSLKKQLMAQGPLDIQATCSTPCNAHTHRNAWAHAHVHVHKRRRVGTHARTHARVHARTLPCSYLHTSGHTQVHIHPCEFTPSGIGTHTCAYRCTRTQTCPHAHAHPHARAHCQCFLFAGHL